MTIRVSEHEVHARMRDRLREADRDRLARLVTDAARSRADRDRPRTATIAARIVAVVERVRCAVARRRIATAVGC